MFQSAEILVQIFNKVMHFHPKVLGWVHKFRIRESSSNKIKRKTNQL